MPRLPAGYTKVVRRNKDGTRRTYFRTRFYKLDASGRRKRFSIYGLSLQDVTQKRQRVENRRITSFDAEKQRFSDFLEQWLHRCNRERNWAPRTFELNSHLARKHILPRLGALPLGKVSKDIISTYFHQLNAGSRTRQQIYLVLHAALGEAVEDDLLSSSPIGRGPKHVYKQFRSLTKSEVKTLLETAKSTRHFVLIHLALTTGMRQGELFALRWEHVDFENRFLSVVSTLTRINGDVLLRPPKGRRMRRVDLSGHDVEILRAHQKCQAVDGACEWVFTDTEGKPLQRHNFWHRDWTSIVNAAQIGKLRFHDLRHTTATLALAAGVPVKAVQERLGHASAKMTLDVYAKVVPSLQLKAAEQMTGIFRDWYTSWYTSAGSDEKNAVK